MVEEPTAGKMVPSESARAAALKRGELMSEVPNMPQTLRPLQRESGGVKVTARAAAKRDVRVDDRTRPVAVSGRMTRTRRWRLSPL
jgi:hypothetical protein